MKRLFGQRKSETAPAATSGPSPATAPAAGQPVASKPVAIVAANPAADARRLDMRGLKAIVTDEVELRKGTEVFDKGGLAHLARHGERIFCDAAGSGASPYRVTITLPAAGDTKSRCTCMAARSRPVCKHAAALLVAWSRAPESFVISDAPPPAPETATKRAAVKTGKVKPQVLMGTGVEQTLALVRELAAAGVATAASDRPEQIRGLAETLRANGLRRLSARVVALADMLAAGSRRRGSLAPLAYADVVGDLLLTARRLEKHLAGETLEDRYLEELVGRNWGKADRKPQEGLQLVEYAYLTRETSDAFVIRERRFLDLTSGTHYSEKQILPAFLARRTQPLESQPGVRIAGTAGVYPGFAPHRLDADGIAPAGALGPADLDRIAELALSGPTAALATFQEQRRDVFAPDRVPVALKADGVVVVGDHLAVIGPDGAALLLAPGGEILEALAGGHLAVVLGDIDLDGILAVLHPLAVVTAAPAPTLRSVVASPESHPDSGVATTRDWLESARASGASAAALSLAEVRDELATVLVNGLASLTERVADPLATRLADLGLERPSALLREMAARPDPADRLEDLVKLQQVLGIGAVRLAATRTVTRDNLIPVPSQPSLLIPDPGEALPPMEVLMRRAAGRMTAYEAAVHNDRYIRQLPAAALTEILPWWATASCADAVAGVFAARGEPPYQQIAEALTLEYGVTAALTAVRILRETPDRRADELLREASSLHANAPYADNLRARAVRVAAAAALRVRAAGGGPVVELPPPLVPGLLQALAGAGRKEDRAEAAVKLAEQESLAALPGLRRSWRSDVDSVRRPASVGLTSLGDTSMVDEFIDCLLARGRQEEVAKTAALALGRMGDVRGIAALLDALAEGWRSTMILDALYESGQAAVSCVVARVMDDPSLSKRRAFVSALEGQSPEAATEALVDALSTTIGATRRARTVPAATERATALLRLSTCYGTTNEAVARRILAIGLGDTPAEKALAKAAQKVLAPKKEPAKGK